VKALVKVVQDTPKRLEYEVSTDGPKWAVGFVLARISINPSQPLSWMNARKHEGDPPPTAKDVLLEKAEEIVARAFHPANLEHTKKIVRAKSPKG